MKTYAQKYQSKEHLKAAHDTDGDDCTRNFICPFICGGKTLQNKSTIVTVTHATGMILVRHCEYKSNRLTTVFITFTGSKTLKFSMLAEFHLYIYMEGEGRSYVYHVCQRPTDIQSTWHMYIHKIPKTTAV